MTYVEGDPGHIDVHESIRLLFMAAGLDPDLIPAEATLGATTHIDDHNRIAEALQWIDDNGVLGEPNAVVASTTGSPATSTVDGDACYKWTSNGSITLTSAGMVTVMLVGGGGGGGAVYHHNGSDGGAGGVIRPRPIWLPAGIAIPVTVGAAGAAGAALYAAGGQGGNSSDRKSVV